MKIFPLEASQGCSAPIVNLGPPDIPETITARKLKIYTHLDFVYEKFSAGSI